MRRSLALFSTAALAMLVAAAPAQAAAGSKKHGTTKGMIDLPGGGQDGHAKGGLFDPAGNLKLVLEAKLVRKSPAGAPVNAGEMKGALHLPGQQNPVAVLKGHYVAGPNGKGFFFVKVLKPQGQGQPPKLIGMVAAKLFDPQPNGTPGKFKGKFVLK